MEKNTLQLLGTGSSMGIPVIGCNCLVCLSDNPKNKRYRTSALLTIENKKFLIDASPDFRSQALLHHIDHIDGVVLTHMHFDHIAGIDDLRVFNYREKRLMPLLIHQKSYEIFREKYAYLFQKSEKSMAQTAKFDCHVVKEERAHFEFLNTPFQLFSYTQAAMHVMGLRYRDFAFVTDIREYPETIYQDLKGVRVLILSALRQSLSPVHLNIDEAVAFSRKVKAEKTYFVHMAHEIEHEKVASELPNGVELGYDGLIIEL